MPINLETDLLGKYIERWLSTRPAGSHVTWDVLRQAGFDTLRAALRSRRWPLSRKRIRALFIGLIFY